MPATRLGFDSVLRQTSLLWRIRENLQSVWTLPRVALAAPRPADGVPIQLLDERRARRNPRAQLGFGTAVDDCEEQFRGSGTNGIGTQPGGVTVQETAQAEVRDRNPTRGPRRKLYACAAPILCTRMKLARQKCRGK
jgi:hypothetical protein